MTSRLFFAVVVGPPAREAFRETAEGLRKVLGSGVRWMEQEPHLTLAFLGEVPPERVSAAGAACRAAAAGQPPFRARLGALGAFPSWTSSRVLWLGLEDAGPMRGLALSLRDSLLSAGFSLEDRGFVPHVTLARSKGGRSFHADSLREGAPPLGGPAEFSVAEVVLFKSTLGPSGPFHEPLERIPLGGPR